MKSLHIFLILSLALTVGTAFSQVSSAARGFVVREIHAVSLADDTPMPALFFLDAKGKPVPFNVGALQRGEPNLVPIINNTLHLFTKSQGPKGEPLMTTVVETPLPEGTTPSLLAFFHDASGRVVSRLLTDDPTDQPAGSVRLVNLSADEILSKIDDTVLSLAPDKGSTLTIANTSGFLYTYGARQPDGSIFKSPTKRLRLPKADMRLLILYATRTEIRNINNHIEKVLIVRDACLVDQVPLQPAATIAQATTLR
jgi:hypothetical protein